MASCRPAGEIICRIIDTLCFCDKPPHTQVTKPSETAGLKNPQGINKTSKWYYYHHSPRDGHYSHLTGH